MEKILSGLVLLCIVATALATCVDDKKVKLKECFDALKNDLATENPADSSALVSFLCSEKQKANVDCITRHFQECQEFMNETFINDLKHIPSKFYAKDLFYLKSANEVCKCLPARPCLNKIKSETKSTPLYQMVEDRQAWKKEANPSYICGPGRTHIDCVARSLPTCLDYLQYKFDEGRKAGEEYIEVLGLQYAGTFAEKRCSDWPKEDHKCSLHRATWQSVGYCYDLVEKSFKKELQELRMCGMRKCVERAMFTCPAGDMDYFIDAVNVFAEERITAEPCQLASASVTIASILSVLLSVCLTLMF